MATRDSTRKFKTGLLVLMPLFLTTASIADPVFPIKKKQLQLKPKPKPTLNLDLEVSSITMVPHNPVAGQNVVFSFTVTNTGAVETPAAETLATFWDTQGGADWGEFSVSTPEIPPLQPGHDFPFKVNVTFITLGDHAGVSLKVDRFNKISESDETNNEKRHFFNVTCKPELSPYDYRKPKPPVQTLSVPPNQKLNHSISVYNNSWCQSLATTMSVSCDDMWPITVDIPPVNGRQKIDHPVSLQWSETGMKNCKMKVDQAGTNVESIETNNEGKFRVSVNPAWPTK